MSCCKANNKKQLRKNRDEGDTSPVRVVKQKLAALDVYAMSNVEKSCMEQICLWCLRFGQIWLTVCGQGSHAVAMFPSTLFY